MQKYRPYQDRDARIQFAWAEDPNAVERDDAGGLGNSPLSPPLLIFKTYKVFGFGTLKLFVNTVGVPEYRA